MAYWILATFLLCLACSSRRMAREAGGRIRTSYRWCWWFRSAALSYEMRRQLDGTAEADDLYHTAGRKGQAKHAGHAGATRSASPAGNIMTKTSRPLTPGLVAPGPVTNGLWMGESYKGERHYLILLLYKPLQQISGTKCGLSKCSLFEHVDSLLQGTALQCFEISLLSLQTPLND
jgi:hypothetical protein